MLRTGQSPAPLRGGLPPPRRRDLAQRRECRYRGPWRLPGPDSHRLAAVSLALGYTSLPLSSLRRPSYWTHIPLRIRRRRGHSNDAAAVREMPSKEATVRVVNPQRMMGET